MLNTTMRILVVDDDIDLCMLLERKLQQNGYKVESAVSMAEAEYVTAHFKPDLVLIDINLGGDDGRQLCWKIKHPVDGRQTKVILMSALYYPTSRTLLFGADDFLAKPFVTEFLLQKISAQLEEDPATVVLVPEVKVA
ncbi:MAG: response regulator [Chitinophagaceae bacterium]|nr:MAG: response regulator [Chitinophagaceae bacterium]